MSANESNPTKVGTGPMEGPKSLIGTTIGGRYRLEKLLGEGGMGAVYQAEHTLMRKRMAIKVLHPELLRMPEVVARFEREAVAAGNIDSPHVVTATDFGKLDDGAFYLALEFVEGRSLREVLAQGRLELGRCLHIGRQIAAALQRAHALKIVHRDLKPENVMLVERDGDPDFVKVLDFGIAKVSFGESDEPRSAQSGPAPQVLTQAGMVYGTPEYMAPEQALGQPVDPRADLYALGVMMYEMLTGLRPFEADSKVALLGMQVTAPPPPMAKKCPDANVPPEVEALVLRLLAKEATERTSEARVLVDEINGDLANLAAAGLVDGSYAVASSALGRISSPQIFTGAASSPVLTPTGARLPAAGASAGTIAKPGLLAGKSWLVAALAGTVGLVVLVATILVVLRGRSPETPHETGEPEKPSPGLKSLIPGTTDSKVAAAIAMIDRGDYGSGIKAIEDLGEGVQGRADVHRALLAAYAATDKPRDAMREVGLVLKTSPQINLRDELKMRVEVRNTALKFGTSTDPTTKAAADEAFALLEGQMGTVGWDDLWDIAYGRAGEQYPKPVERAKQSFKKEGAKAKMGPATAVAYDLRASGLTCAAKAHFDRAVKEGDERALDLLKQLVPPQIHGRWRKVDALACIHTDGSVKKAVEALEERLKAKK